MDYIHLCNLYCIQFSYKLYLVVLVLCWTISGIRKKEICNAKNKSSVQLICGSHEKIIFATYTVNTSTYTDSLITMLGNVNYYKNRSLKIRINITMFLHFIKNESFNPFRMITNSEYYQCNVNITSKYL